MQNAGFVLCQGLFADVAGDWLIHVVEADARHAGVFYIGKYPYDVEGHALHPDAPAVAALWDHTAPGARQISQRQKRVAQFITAAIFEPVFGLLHA